MDQWYALHTHPHKERFVAAQLRASGRDVYLPVVRVQASAARAGRVQPFFPNYAFIHVDLERVSLSTIQWVPGLRRLVQCAGEPAVVPGEVIARLKQQLAEIHAAGGLRLRGLEPGDAVRIVGGPFEGYEAIFDARLPGKERVRVLLEMLAASRSGRSGRAVRVELNAGDIVKAKRKRRRGRRRH